MYQLIIILITFSPSFSLYFNASRLTFGTEDLQNYYTIHRDFCRSLDLFLTPVIDSNPHLNNSYWYFQNSPDIIRMRDQLQRYAPFSIVALCNGTRAEFIYFSSLISSEFNIDDTYIKMYLDPQWRVYNAFTDFNHLFQTYTNLTKKFYVNLLNSTAIKSNFRSVFVRFEDKQFNRLIKPTVYWSDSQFAKLLAAMITNNISVNVTTDRDFIIDTLYFHNYSRTSQSHDYSDGFRWSIFSGLLGAFEDLFVNIFTNILKYFVSQIVEPLIKTIINVLWSLLPIFEKLVILLSQLINNLLCMIINIIYILDKYLKIFEMFIIIFISLYYFNSIYMAIYIILIFIILFQFQRSDNLSILAEIIDYSYRNSTCTIYKNVVLSNGSQTSF